MSDNISESDAFAPSVPEPQMGDRTYPFVVPQALKALADRTRYLINGFTGSGDSSASILDNTNTGVFDAKRFNVLTRSPVLANFAYQIVSTTRFIRQYAWGATESINFMPVPVCPHVEGDGTDNYQPPGANIIAGGPVWNSWASGSRLAWYQFATPSGVPVLYWSVRGLPPAGGIVGYNLRVKGGTGHTTLTSVTLPTLSLWKQAYGGAPSQIAIVTDPSATFTAYQAEHDITITDQTERIAPNTNYFFKLTGETGTNKLPGLFIYECGISIGP